VGTRTPGNLGAVCRAAAAFGFPDVRVVQPAFPPDHEEARWLAHGAGAVLRAVRVHHDLADALAGCFRSAATTARPRHSGRPVRTPAEAAAALREADAAHPYGVVFGPEDRGLTNEELSLCDEVLSIPLPEGRGATLSLPAAATIVAWELACGPASVPPRPPARPLDTADLDALLAHIHAALDRIGFRPRPDAVRFRGALRDFVARARPTEGDRRVLRHVFAQVGKWQRRLEGELRRGDRL
jgi:TrmH family RNA methyltransferase